jgi:hypothetical protein
VSAQTASTTYIIDFEGLEEGAIINEVSCGSGITCPSGSPDFKVLVNGHNQLIPNSNTAMIFDAECLPDDGGDEGSADDCSGEDDDLFFPGHGKTLINSEDLNSSDPDDQDEDGSFLEFDFFGFTGTVTIDSVDVGDVEEIEAKDAFINFHGGSCSEQSEIETHFDILRTGDNVIRTIPIGASAGIRDAQCVQVRLNGSGTIDNIKFTVGPTPAPAITIEKATNGQDADVPTGPVVPAGSTVNFTYLVTNTGNVALTNVVVTDDQGVAVSCPLTTLPVGPGNNSMTCTGSTIATAGQYANVGRACGDGAGQNVCDEDPSHHFGANPIIDIEKATNGQDADDPTGPVVLIGTTVAFTYLVTNTGNVDLSNVTVMDDQGVTVSCPQVSLAVGESMTCTGSTTATAGQYANVGTACGDGTGSQQHVCNEDPSHHFGADPGIDIEKATNGQDADDPNDAPQINAGDQVTWSYTVTNSGNVALDPFVIDDNGTPCPPEDASCVVGNPHFDDDFTPTLPDPNPGDTNTNDLLDPGETWTYTASATARDLPTAAVPTVPGCGGSGRPTYQNKAVVTANSGNGAGTEVTDADLSHYCNPPAPGEIDIEKYTKIAVAPTGGDVCATFGKPEKFTWRYTGDDEQKHSQQSGKVKVKGQLDGLPASEKARVKITSEKDFDGEVDLGHDFDTKKGKIIIKNLNGQVLKEIEIHTSCSQPMNLGDKYGGVMLVRYTGKKGTSATFDPNPDDGIGEDADEPTGPSGQVDARVTWTYEVTNPGAVSLTDVVVTDDNGTPDDTADDFSPTLVSGDDNNNQILEITETWRYQATGTVKAGQYKNISGVSGKDPQGNPVTDQDPSHHIGLLPQGDICEGKGKLQTLTMRYTGGNVLDHSQDSGKANASGDPGTASPVQISVGEHFNGTVNLGDDFIIDATGSRLGSNTRVLIKDQAGKLLQTIDFHTSCSQPLERGDRFGAIQVIDATSTR